MAITRNSHSARGADRPRGNRPRYVPRRRVCAFCADKSKVIDFRDAGKLRRYISERAKIEGRRKTATCAKHQRQMAEAIKRARHLALLPYTLAHIRLSGGAGFRVPGAGRYGLPVREVTPQTQPVAGQPAAQAPAVTSSAPVEPTAAAETAPTASTELLAEAKQAGSEKTEF